MNEKVQKEVSKEPKKLGSTVSEILEILKGMTVHEIRYILNSVTVQVDNKAVLL